MTEPLHGPGAVARVFTRARILSIRLTRLSLGDKSIDLPFQLSRTQLTVLAIGAVIGVVAYGLGSLAGIAAFTTWPVVVLTIAALVAVGYSSVPERGGLFFLEGLARSVWSRVPLVSASTVTSRSRAQRRSEVMACDASLRVGIHPAPGSSGGRNR